MTMRKQGFTLIELVIIIIVLGVLAVAILPKLIGSSSFENYTVKDQLISRLRLAQLKNMNADPSSYATVNACYWVVTKSTCFYSEHTAKDNMGECSIPSDDVDCDAEQVTYDEHNVVTYSDGILSQANYLFDIQGRLIEGNSPIELGDENELSITIESEGYIHE